MQLNLKRDLVFFDIEATGLNVVKDRIVQIAAIKFKKNSDQPEELSMLINPGIPISEEAFQVHGISNLDVANKPTFEQVAEHLFDFFGDSDLAGYNSNRYDLPLLMEEFARVGLDFTIDQRNLVDVQKIFYKMEPRTLTAALQFYCNETFENAHDALADVRATVKVFKRQLEKYTDLEKDISGLHEFTKEPNTLDATQRLKYGPNGEVIFNFGKYAGRPVLEVFQEDKSYYSWIMTKDFSVQVKQILKKLVHPPGNLS
jgi:DNA polymerase III subunit epsilon